MIFIEITVIFRYTHTLLQEIVLKFVLPVLQIGELSTVFRYNRVYAIASRKYATAEQQSFKKRINALVSAWQCQPAPES